MKKFLSLILALIMVCSITLAHSGRTDANGGHHNRSTGEYHYHHGYSAHQHENGVCPYSKINNATSTSNKNNSDTSSTPTSIAVQKDKDSNKATIDSLLGYGIIFIFISPYIIALLAPVYTWFENKFNKK